MSDPTHSRLSDLLSSVVRLQDELSTLREGLEQAIKEEPAEPESPLDSYVTLDQCAAMVHRSKRTLEHYRDRLPEPAVEGGGGRPHLWRWSKIRTWLEEIFGLNLPEKYPGS